MSIQGNIDGQSSALSSNDKAISTASWILRVAVLIHMVGLTYALHTRVGSSLGGVALMDWGVTHATIGFHERLWSRVLLALALLLLIKPIAPVAFIIGAALMAETAAAYSFGGNHFVEWVWQTNALRYGLPIALGVYLLGEHRWKVPATAWILRIAIACVFIFHGIAALQKHPGFIDLLIGTTANLTGLRLTESSAVAMMQVIGIVDVIAALLLLIKPWPPLLAWLCFWGLLTALSRVTTYGIMSFPEVLVRASHFLAPVAVYTLLHGAQTNTGSTHSECDANSQTQQH